MNEIRAFDGEYAFLSNFAASRFIIYTKFPDTTPGMQTPYETPTVEHAYQAYKTHDRQMFHDIMRAATPGQAKRLGRKLEPQFFRPDWDDVKENIMLELLEKKFEDRYLQEQLLSTGDAVLVEGNTWHDNIWGDCGCLKCTHKPGQNMLGYLLMQVRDRISRQGNDV